MTSLPCKLFGFFATGMVAMLLPAAVMAQPAGSSTDEFFALFRDVYLYAYPIASIDVTMHQATNVPNASMINLRAPAGIHSSLLQELFRRTDGKDQSPPPDDALLMSANGMVRPCSCPTSA